VLRIIAGRARGRRLQPPTWRGLRPTSDSLRESLFNVLGPRLNGARVLDAFAGTGALGLEAWSRGARSVVFVDLDRRAITLIADNVRRCGAQEDCAMIRADASRKGSLGSAAFDVVLADPPYETADLEGILNALAAQVVERGLLVLEHTRRRAAPERVGVLLRVRQMLAGDSALSFYESRPDGGVVIARSPGTDHER
jgi:16S rRNA (guanine(966)-N(2))-methyltransferase RsmD